MCACAFGSSVTKFPWYINTFLLTVHLFSVPQFVMSTGSGVNGFTLDPSLGEFILTHPDIRVSSLKDVTLSCFFKILFVAALRSLILS